MYPMHLIKFVIPWEKWKKCQHLKEYTANSPVVHFVIVVSIGKKTFRWTVPPSRDVLSERWLRIYASARAKISELNLVVLDQDILSRHDYYIKNVRFNISMKNSVLMHMVYRLKYLVHVEFHSLLR